MAAGWRACSLGPLPSKNTVSMKLSTAISACYASLPSSASFPVRSLEPASPLDSLLSGRWVKLICGASFEDVADVRNLSLVYTLAGVDCIDCAADSSVVEAVREGVDAASQMALAHSSRLSFSNKPWIMVSINDDEDVHFRKAAFDSNKCPPSCPRPCVRICPASAIMLSDTLGPSLSGGVLNERCYGCGRCIPACPLNLIGANPYVRNIEDTSNLLKFGSIDAVEIHTNARNLEAFINLWQSLYVSMQGLKLIAVSLPDVGDEMLGTMWDLYNIMSLNLKSLNLWQLDGRPMSGDIGAGATWAAVKLAAKVVALTERPPGFLQLAGGTNSYTVKAMTVSGLFQKGLKANLNEMAASKRKDCAAIAGIAYGGYARKILSQILGSINQGDGSSRLEDYPQLFWNALREAKSLVATLKER